MIFSALLHIFQSEHYDRKRFLKFVYSHFDWWNFSVRGKTQWTLRAKLLMAGALIFFAIPLFYSIFTIIFLLFLFPFFLVLADFFVRPLVSFQKKKIFEKAKVLVKNSGVITIAITGSFGKTTMKTILESVLSQKFKVFTVPGNINTDLGVANFLLNNSEKLQNSEILLLEIGAYTTGEIASTCEIVKPDYSFLTAIAPVHLERFGSVENIVKAKMELPENTKKRAYFLKNTEPNIPLPLFDTNPEKYQKISAEKSEQSVEFLPDFSGLSFEWEGETFISRLIAAHTVEQMVAALRLAKELGLSIQEMQKGIEKIPFPEHRLQVTKNVHTKVTVIDDSYNGNFDGFVSALQTLSRSSGRKIVLTPGIVELGEMQEKVHTDLAKLYAEKIDILLLIENSNTKIIEKEFHSPLVKRTKGIVKVYKTAMQAHADLPNILHAGDTILFQNDLPDNYR